MVADRYCPPDPYDGPSSLLTNRNLPRYMGERLPLLDVNSYACLARHHIRSTVPRALEKPSTQRRSPVLLAIFRSCPWSEVEIPGFTPAVED